jgi:hypothetical protein
VTERDLDTLAAQLAAMTRGLEYHHDLGWLSGTADDGEIYTVANLSLDSTESGRCYNARANGSGLAALANNRDALLALAREALESRAVRAPVKQRGVDFPCEECGKLDGNYLVNGWYRCRACGFPGQ